VMMIGETRRLEKASARWGWWACTPVPVPQGVCF